MADATGLGGVGFVTEYGGRDDPGNGWALADGRSMPRTGTIPGGPANSYATLFDAICPIIGTTVNISSASPALLTTPLAHNLSVGDSVILQGAVPAAFTADAVVYYVASVPSATTFTLSTTIANGVVGTPINNTGAAVNGLVVRHCPHGLPAVSPGTNFLIQDTRGRSLLVRDNIGSSRGAAGRLPTTLAALGRSDRDNASAGFETIAVAAAESGVPPHGHGGATSNTGTVSANAQAPGSASGSSGGGGSGHGHGLVYTLNDAGAHHHWLPTVGINLATGGNTTLNSANGGNFPGWQSNGINQDHSHWINAPAGTGGDGHGHSVSIAQSFNVPIPGLKILPETLAAAAQGHNNMHPHAVTNHIVRIY